MLLCPCCCSPTFVKTRTDGYPFSLARNTCSDKKKGCWLSSPHNVFGFFLSDNDVIWSLLFYVLFWHHQQLYWLISHICGSVCVVQSHSSFLLSTFFLWFYDSTWSLYLPEMLHFYSCFVVLICAVVHWWSWWTNTIFATNIYLPKPGISKIFLKQAINLSLGQGL